MADIFRQYKARNGEDGGPRSGFIALAASMALHVGVVVVFFALSSSSPVNLVGPGGPTGDPVRPGKGKVTWVDLGGPENGGVSQEEQQARQEQERQAQLQQEQQARQEQERQAQLQQEQQARQEQERQDQLQQEQQVLLEKERQAQLQQEQQALLEKERQAQLQQEQQALLEKERLAQLEKDRQAQLEKDRQAQREKDRLAQLEKERQELDRGIGDALAALEEKMKGQGGGAAPGDEDDPAKAAYYRYIQNIVSRNWLAPADVSATNLVAAYEIVIQPGGQVSSKLLKSSGNTLYDSSVERALIISSPFMPLPAIFNGQAITVQLNFSLDELRRGA